jgi:hypothetical protein
MKSNCIGLVKIALLTTSAIQAGDKVKMLLINHPNAYWQLPHNLPPTVLDNWGAATLLGQEDAVKKNWPK